MGNVAELRRRSVDARTIRAAGVNVGRHGAATLAMHAMAMDFPQVLGHPNRLPFEGVRAERLQTGSHRGSAT
jgi:hypothetical protein